MRIAGPPAEKPLMVTVNSGALRAAHTDMLQVHRRVVRVGAAAAWFSAAVFLLAGFATGNDGLFVQSVGPMIAAGFMTAQIMLRREDTGSVGLGLSVARQLAELMGGSLTYRRDQGESVFRLELPLSEVPVFEDFGIDGGQAGDIKRPMAH